MHSFPETFRDRHICIMGLGYVGLTLAVVMAEVGYQVTGVEIRTEAVASLRRGKPHFFEPGLEGRLQRVVNSGRLDIQSSIPKTTPASVYIVTVGTPLDANGKVRIDMMSHVAEEIAQSINDGDLVIMRSTVELGTTNRIVRPILDKAGKRFDLAFCPERTLEGQALKELRELPQIVGGDDVGVRARAMQIFQYLTPTVVQVSSLETAELIKLTDNAQRDVLFGLANEVARISDAIGVSAMEVIRAGKLGYPRTNIALPGPVGGPCLEKDPHILANGLKPFGVTPEIILAARHLNERQPQEVITMLQSFCAKVPDFPEAPSITLAGVAFKGRPETDDLRGTMALPILAALRTHFPKARFLGFDAVVAPEKIRSCFDLAPAPRLEAAFDKAHLVVIANNHLCFERMPLPYLAQSMARPGIIFDFWNNFADSEIELPEGIHYAGLGNLGRTIRQLGLKA